jgi:hypothetical protein
MPSPDFSDYIDLTINDKQPGDIYDEAVDYARLAMPEFSPRPGTIEDAILQAGAYIGSLNLGNINRLPDGIMEGVLRYLDILRKEATFGSVELEFTLSEAGGIIPAETLAVYEIVSGDDVIQYPFSTDSTVVANSASTTVTVNATSLTAGVLPTIASGTQLVLAQPSAAILDVYTSGNVSQGSLAETTTEYFSRGTSHLESLSSVLATGPQVEKYILTNFVDVYRCKVYDVSKAVNFSASAGFLNGFNSESDVATVSTSADFVDLCNDFNTDLFMVLAPDYYGDTTYQSIIRTGVYQGASSGSSSVEFTNINTAASGVAGPISVVSMNSIEHAFEGDFPGYFVIYACDSGGSPLTSTLKAEIVDAVAERIPAGLEFSLLDAYPFDIAVTATISINPEFGANSVATAVASEIETLLSLAEWPNWNTTVRIFDIVVAASRVAGVDYVYSIGTSVPTYPAAKYPGNELLATEVNIAGSIIGYEIGYYGVLPRATVEVVVL